jgi:hypothetical protein
MENKKLIEFFIVRILVLLPVCFLNHPFSTDEIHYLQGIRPFFHFIIFLKVLNFLPEPLLRLSLVIFSSSSVFSMFAFSKMAMPKFNSHYIALVYVFNPFVMYFSIRFLPESLLFFIIPFVLWLGYKQRSWLLGITTAIFLPIKWTMILYSMFSFYKLQTIKSRIESIIGFTIFISVYVWYQLTVQSTFGHGIARLGIFYKSLITFETPTNIIAPFIILMFVLPLFDFNLTHFKKHKLLIVLTLIQFILFFEPINDYIRNTTNTLAVYSLFVKRCHIILFIVISLIISYALIILRIIGVFSGGYV